MSNCSIPDCASGVFAARLCRKHYEIDRRARLPGVPCTMPGCSRRQAARALCAVHYTRWRRYGDPTHVTPREEYIARGAQLPQYRHGLERHPLYPTWRNMVSRCTRPNDHAYPDYGGRGIKVCDRWLDIRNFIADVGDRPAGTSLDRVDNNGNYEPGNVRWATPKEQRRNRRNVRRSKGARLNAAAAASIRQLYAQGLTTRELATQFGCSIDNVRLVLKQRIWAEA